jgi:hypothetical protein
VYASGNPKTKKLLKESVAIGQALRLEGAPSAETGPRIFSPGPFPAKENGVDYVEGPHYPKAHTWYAKVEVKDGVIVKVLS